MKIANKLMPLKTTSNYYIYDSLNRNIYPCSDVVFLLIKHCGGTLDLDCTNLPSIRSTIQLYKDCTDENIEEAISLVKAINNTYLKNSKLMISKEFPVFTNKDILKSLALSNHVVFEITEKCNLSCVYCCYGDLYKKTQMGSQKHKSDILTYLNAVLDLKNTYNIGYENFAIAFYGGEPLVRFDVIGEIIQTVKGRIPKNCNVRYSMTSNGVLLKKHIEFLVENNFDILISLDGNDSHNSYRVFPNGENSFKIIENNLIYIQKSYPEFFKKKIQFISVLHNRNECIGVCHYFSKFDKIPTFSPLSNRGVKSNKCKIFQNINSVKKYTKNEIDEIKTSYPDIYDSLFSDKKMKEELFKKEEFESFTEIFQQDIFYPDASCYLFENRVFIDIEGYIYLCEKSDRKFRFGRIINGKINLYRDKINTYYESINKLHKEKCSRICLKYSSCKKCFFCSSEQIIAGTCRVETTSLAYDLVEVIKQEEGGL